MHRVRLPAAAAACLIALCAGLLAASPATDGLRGLSLLYLPYTDFGAASLREASRSMQSKVRGGRNRLCGAEPLASGKRNVA